MTLTIQHGSYRLMKMTLIKEDLFAIVTGDEQEPDRSTQGYKAGHRRSLSNAFITVSQQVDAPPTFASLGCSQPCIHTRSRTPSFFSAVAAVYEYGV